MPLVRVLLDMERAVKISGARFSVLRGMGAALERGLASFLLDSHVKAGYVEVSAPHLVSRQTMTGTGQLPKFEPEMFKTALGDSLFREQYLDAVASIIAEQEAAGLDIVTDGDSRFDLTVGGKSWFFYPIERLGGVCGHRDTSRGWMSRHGLRPGKILWEVQEAYQPGVVTEKLTRGPLEYTALWQVAQRMTDRPLKFGAICAPALASMLWNEFYEDDKAMILDLCDIMNAELREMATIVERTVADHEGTPVKWLGDGVMVHFRDPVSAVRATLEMVAAAPDLGLPAHAGVAAGPVVMQDGDYFGRTVNLAARIAAGATAGQTLVSGLVAELAAAPGLSFREVGPIELKGFAEPVTVHEASVAG